MMVLDFHEKNLAKKLGREPREINYDECQAVYDECEKNENGRITKEEMSKWVKAYMKKHKDCEHEHKLVLGKMISEKEEKLCNYMAGNEEALTKLIEGNNGFAGDIVSSAAKAWKAVSKGNWEIAKREFEPILLEIERFGGSRAQRDLLEFAYVNVLLRTGKKEAARKILLNRRPAFYQASAIKGLAD